MRSQIGWCPFGFPLKPTPFLRVLEENTSHPLKRLEVKHITEYHEKRLETDQSADTRRMGGTRVPFWVGGRVQMGGFLFRDSKGIRSVKSWSTKMGAPFGFPAPRSVWLLPSGFGILSLRTPVVRPAHGFARSLADARQSLGLLMAYSGDMNAATWQDHLGPSFLSWSPLVWWF